MLHGTGSAMHLNDHRIFFGRVIRIEVGRIQQPALQIESVVLPVDAPGFTPCRLKGSVTRSDLLPFANRASPDFRRMRQRLANHGRSFAILSKGHGRAPSIGDKLARSASERCDSARSWIDGCDSTLAVHIFTKKNFAAGRPCEPTRGSLHAWSNIFCFAALRGNNKDIAAHGGF